MGFVACAICGFATHTYYRYLDMLDGQSCLSTETPAVTAASSVNAVTRNVKKSACSDGALDLQ